MKEELERATSMMREKHWSVTSCTPPVGAGAHNQSIGPDWESNHEMLVPESMLNPRATPAGLGQFFLMYVLFYIVFHEKVSTFFPIENYSKYLMG